MSQVKSSSIEPSLVASRVLLAPLTKGSNENSLFWVFVGVSVLVHTLVLVASAYQWIHEHPPLNTDEWSLDADIVTDLDLNAPTKAALPQAELKPEAKAPVQLLPQLPQKFSVKEAAKPEDMIPVEKEKVAPPPPSPPAAPPTPVVKAEEMPIKTDNKTDNQMTAAEILKRAAMDRLRAEQKTAKTAEAPDKDDAARLGEALFKENPTAGSALAKGKMNAYKAKLTQAIKRNYAVPEASSLKDSGLQVILVITVSENGDLMDLQIKQPSGNAAYDDDTVRSVRASVPLPRPPAEFVGQPIAVAFSPKGA